MHRRAPHPVELLCPLTGSREPPAEKSGGGGWRLPPRQRRPGKFLATGCPLPPVPPKDPWDGSGHRDAPWRRNRRFLSPKMRTLEKMSTRLPLQSPRFLLGLFRLLLAEGRSQCCSLACRFWRIKPLAMAAAMAGRRLAHAGRRRGGQRGGRRRGAQPRRGPIPGAAGKCSLLWPEGAAAAGHPRPAAPGSWRRRGSPHGCPAAPPAVPRRRGTCSGGRRLRAGWQRKAVRSERNAGQSRARSGRVRPAASLSGAAPQPRAAAAARSPAAAIAIAGAATAAYSRLPPDDCQVLQKSASGESNLLRREL